MALRRARSEGNGWLGAIAGLAASCAALAPAHAAPLRSSTVGMPARIEQLVLPGPELAARPIADRRTPLVVRITESYPHGSAFRYDISYYGLEPGAYDLRDFLVRKDGSPARGLPPIPVSVTAVLPPGRVEPNRPELGRSPWLGGYRLILGLAVSLWTAGLAAIVLVGRRRWAEAPAEAERPATLADRLRPLVDAALAGTLTQAQHAELERLLIGYWRQRLDLEDMGPAQAIAALKDHDEAGPLIRQLEDWLHRPPRDGSAEPVDVAGLLRPYQDLLTDEPEVLARGAEGRP